MATGGADNRRGFSFNRRLFSFCAGAFVGWWINTSMSYLTLSELKTHLRLNGSAEDGPLQVYIDATEAAFVSLTNKTLDTNATTGFPAGVPGDVKLALLHLAGHFYRVREAYTDQDVAAMPFGFVSVCRRYSTKFVSPGVL